MADLARGYPVELAGLRTRQAFSPVASPPKLEELVVVTGLPRSGTSLLMSMLGAGGLPLVVDTLRPADAHNPKGYFENSAVLKLESDTSWLGDCQGQAIKILYRQLPLVPPTVPAKILLTLRDVQEVVASQKAMLAKEQDDDWDWEDLFRRELGRFRSWLSQQEWPVLEVAHSRMLGHPQAVALEIADFLGHPLDLAAMQEVVDPTLYRARKC